MKAAPIHDLTDLIDPNHAPCISLYERTQRGYPGNQQNPVRFRSLVRDAESALLARYPDRDPGPLLKPLRELAEDREFWNQAHEGLAVFVSPDLFRVIGLNRAVAEGTMVSDSFHLKPLIRIIQSADHYQVLCLSRNSASLFEGNRDGLEPIELAPGIPTSNDEALTLDQGAGDDRIEHVPSHRRHANEIPSHTQRSYGTDLNSLENDAARFFRAIDRGIMDHHGKPLGLPLVLVALAENQELFRTISHNANLIEPGVIADPTALTHAEIKEAAWNVAARHYQTRLSKLVSAFEEARGRGHGSADFADVMRCAVQGQVRTLLIDADRNVPGRFNSATGEIEFLPRDDSEATDLLDDLAKRVLSGRGEVVVVPSSQMPENACLAAIYRY